MRLRRVLALGTAAVTAGAGLFCAPAPAQAAPAGRVDGTAQAAPAGRTGATAPAAVQVTLASTIALSNCSASLVRFPTSVGTDPAMMLTNGHCYEGGLIDSGTVLQNRTSTRAGTLLSASGSALGRVRANLVLYATMTGTDVTLYRLNTTFTALQASYGVTPLTISAAHPDAGTLVAIPSGYWREIWDCQIDGFVHELHEAEWVWDDSIRYDAGCDTIGGTSGSPVVSTDTGEVVGINNTGNEDGGRCTLDNPCEVDENGAVTVLEGRGYGEQTYWFTTCLTSGRTIDLSISGCLLTKP